MDWPAAIEKNRAALKGILALLVAMAGLGGRFTLLWREEPGASGPAPAERMEPSRAPALPRHLYRAVLRLLRPAEAAARRLVIVAARDLVVTLPPPRPRRSKAMRRRKAAGRAGGPTPPEDLASRVPPLPLLDPLRPWRRRGVRRAPRSLPRIRVPGFSEPARMPSPSRDDPVSATRLALRLRALASTLDDLPGQARRFARWRARRDAMRAREEGRPARRLRRVWPLKPGRPPGWCRHPSHEVHRVLDVVHGLAFWVLQSPDTS